MLDVSVLLTLCTIIPVNEGTICPQENMSKDKMTFKFLTSIHGSVSLSLFFFNIFCLDLFSSFYILIVTIVTRWLPSMSSTPGAHIFLFKKAFTNPLHSCPSLKSLVARESRLRQEPPFGTVYKGSPP